MERYNRVRPHEALGMQRPAERYQPSPRRHQPQAPEWDYPAGLEVRRVDAAGTVRVGGRRLFVCEALVHQPVALEAVGGSVLVRYPHMYVRELHPATGSTCSFVHPIADL